MTIWPGAPVADFHQITSIDRLGSCHGPDRDSAALLHLLARGQAL